MILVTAATGQVGSAALNVLIAAGSEVRVLVRDPSTFAAPEGVQVVQGDFDDDTSMAKALKGVAVMLLAGRDSPDSVSSIAGCWRRFVRPGCATSSSSRLLAHPPGRQ
jgi:uncharacterized protein YbjT (DUF2867 family)